MPSGIISTGTGRLYKERTAGRTSNEDHRLMLQHIRRRDAERVEQLVRSLPV
jgi:DNA-binding GntR family transcriptional regulator